MSVRLLRCEATGGLRDAVLRMGGMAPLVWDGQARQIPFKFNVFHELASASLMYEIEMSRLGSTGGFAVGGEQLSTHGGAVSDTVLNHVAHQAPPSEAVLSMVCVSTKMLNFVGPRSRAERRVEPEGQNLIAVLHTLYENDREFEEFLDDAMTSAFPDDYEKLSFPPAEDGRTQLRVRRKNRHRANSASDL